MKGLSKFLTKSLLKPGLKYGKSKPYQVKQIRNMILKYKLNEDL